MIGSVLLVLAAAPAWEPVEVIDGITIEKREVPGERVVELKLTTRARASVSSLCTAGFGPSGLDKNEPDITLRRMLKQDAGEQVTYEQISPPIVNDRDYAVHSKREVFDDGSCKVTFEAANALAPPLPKGFVRIEKLRGSWHFEPAGAETKVTYVIFTDPGGSIPAAFIEGSRRKTAVTWVKLILDRAQQK